MSAGLSNVLRYALVPVGLLLCGVAWLGEVADDWYWRLVQWLNR